MVLGQPKINRDVTPRCKMLCFNCWSNKNKDSEKCMTEGAKHFSPTTLVYSALDYKVKTRTKEKIYLSIWFF